jgi:uncharacterized membrane protein
MRKENQNQIAKTKQKSINQKKVALKSKQQQNNKTKKVPKKAKVRVDSLSPLEFPFANPVHSYATAVAQRMDELQSKNEIRSKHFGIHNKNTMIGAN